MKRPKKRDRGDNSRRQPHDEDQRMRGVHGRLFPSQPQREIAQTDSRPALNPPFASNKTETYPRHQKEAQIPMSTALNGSGQAPRSPEVEQYTHANSHQGVDNGKRRKIFDTGHTNTGCEIPMRFPIDDCLPYNKFIQQSQPPVAMVRRPLQSDDNNNTGYHSTATNNQPRQNVEEKRCKIENRVDYGYEPHGYSVSAWPGHAGSNVRLQPAFNEADNAQQYPYPQQNHHSGNFMENGDWSGELKHLIPIMGSGTHQGYVGMSPQAEQVGAVHPSQMARTPNGSRLNAADYRRTKPPFRGKVEMRKEEAALNEVTTIQSLEGDRFHEDNVCNQCGHFGHWLGDCVFPDDSGYIIGCPIHNAKDHTWDDCPDARKMSLERKIMYLILRRRNKPAIQSTQPWIALVKVALQQGSEEYCWGPSVWTQEFVMKMIREPKAGHPWLDFNYGRQLISTLPKDPETMGDPGVLVEKRLLWDQVYKPFPKRGEPGYGL